ncbi:MAG: L,D-transpeptidase family protein [Planctomycetes bacterium]|nr:L,D-transpeptidase family protein [Planctomycetota bacterium]
MTKFGKAMIVILGVGMLAAALTYAFWPGGPKPGSATQQAQPGQIAQPAPGQTGRQTPGGQNPGQNPPASNQPTTGVDPTNQLARAEAEKLFSQGMELYKAADEAKYVQTRAALAKAMNSMQLSAEQNKQVRAALLDLAEKTVFSKIVYEGDQYAYYYTFKAGKVLARVEREENLHVPEGVILRINGIADARGIRAGQTIKLIRGPFHAVVYKNACVMDLYLQDTFVRQFRVGVGAKESPTPEGYFKLTVYSKMTNAKYTPPANSNLARKAYLPGEPGYPLDSGGHWISLEGLPEKGTKIMLGDGYGIHGTNEPNSIGKWSSHGCVRLADDDIKFVYNCLYPEWSRVTILP